MRYGDAPCSCSLVADEYYKVAVGRQRPSVSELRRPLHADAHKQQPFATRLFSPLNQATQDAYPPAPNPQTPQHYTLAVDLARNLADRKKQHAHIHTNFQVRSGSCLLLPLRNNKHLERTIALVCPACFLRRAALARVLKFTAGIREARGWSLLPPGHVLMHCASGLRA